MKSHFSWCLHFLDPEQGLSKQEIKVRGQKVTEKKRWADMMVKDAGKQANTNGSPFFQFK